MMRSVQENCGLLCCGPKRTNKKNYKCEMLVNWETNLNYLHFRKENLFLTDEHWCDALSAGDPPKSPVALVYLHCTSYCVLHAYQHSPSNKTNTTFFNNKIIILFHIVISRKQHHPCHHQQPMHQTVYNWNQRKKILLEKALKHKLFANICFTPIWAHLTNPKLSNTLNCFCTNNLIFKKNKPRTKRS